MIHTDRQSLMYQCEPKLFITFSAWSDCMCIKERDSERGGEIGSLRPFVSIVILMGCTGISLG